MNIPILFESYRRDGKIVRLNKKLHTRPMKDDYVDLLGEEFQVSWCKIMPVGMKVFVYGLSRNSDFNGWTLIKTED